MTEDDYIDLANLTRLRIAYSVINDCHLDGSIAIGRQVQLSRQEVRIAIEKLEKKRFIK